MPARHITPFFPFNPMHPFRSLPAYDNPSKPMSGGWEPVANFQAAKVFSEDPTPSGGFVCALAGACKLCRSNVATLLFFFSLGEILRTKDVCMSILELVYQKP